MAKNDKKKTEQLANEQRNINQTAQNNLQNNVLNPQSQQATQNFQNAIPGAQSDYNDIMQRYRDFQASPGAQHYNPERVNYNRSGEMQQALTGYGNFANTGGFSENDLGALRARGISPIQAVYQNSRNELDRQRALQGGYSPNYSAALAKMSGRLGSSIADATQNVNARIAEMVQQGKQFGLGGLGNLASTDTGFDMQAQLANQNAGLQAANFNATQGGDAARLAALNGMTNLYSQTPGMLNMFGNQLNQATNNQLQGNQLQQNASQQALSGRQLVNNTASNFETGLGRVGQIANIGGSVAGAFMGMPQQGILPSRQLPGMNNINSGMFSLPGR